MTDHVKTGSIVRIIGPVLDVRFDEGAEPALKTLLVTQTEPPVHVEVVQHYAPGVVRSIALEPTEGLYCGVSVTNTGAGIRVPVGEHVLGRVIDTLLFFDKDHCRTSYESEVLRKQLPSAYR